MNRGRVESRSVQRRENVMAGRDMESGIKDRIDQAYQRAITAMSQKERDRILERIVTHRGQR